MLFYETEGVLSSCQEVQIQPEMTTTGKCWILMEFSENILAQAPEQKKLGSVLIHPKDICSEIQVDLGGGRLRVVALINSYCIPDSKGRLICECLFGFSLVDPYNKPNGCKLKMVQKGEQGEGSNPENLQEKS